MDADLLTVGQEDIVLLLSQVKRDDPNNASIFNILQRSLRDGFNEGVILQLLKLVLDTSDTSLKLPSKELIVNTYMILDGPVSISAVFQIISSLGSTEIYYKRDERFENVKIAKSLQLLVLNWLVHNFEYFKQAMVQSGPMVLSMLIKSLSYEFLRVQISRLIILLLQESIDPIQTFLNRDVNHSMTLLKLWHIKWVVDLYAKFPLDVYLRELLAFFRLVDPGLDYMIYTHDGFQTLNRLKSNEKYIFAKFIENDEDGFENDPIHANKKRKKMLRRNREDSYGINKSLVQLENIYNINPYSLFKLPKSQIDKILPLAFQYAHNLVITKLDEYVRISLFDHLSGKLEYTEFMNQLMVILQAGGGSIQLTLVADFIFQKVPITRDFLETLLFRYQLLKYLSKVDISDLTNIIVQDVTKLLDLKHSEEISRTFINHVVDYFKFNRPDQLATANDMNDIFSMLFKYIEVGPGPKDRLTSLMISLIQTFDPEVIAKLEDHNVIPAPPLVYSMLLDGDPLLLTDICKHIQFCKTYRFKTYDLKSIQNTFIMDTVNFLWRDKFLAYDEVRSSPNKAFYLDPEFINKLGSLHVFDQYLTPSTLGSLFSNPALIFIVTHIVWDLEDKSEMLNVRHEGPITKESVLRLQLNEKVNWLEYSFDELKVKVLQELDRLGFDGLCEFLFGSLRSLSGKRIPRESM